MRGEPGRAEAVHHVLDDHLLQAIAGCDLQLDDGPIAVVNLRGCDDATRRDPGDAASDVGHTERNRQRQEERTAEEELLAEGHPQHREREGGSERRPASQSRHQSKGLVPGTGTPAARPATTSLMDTPLICASG